MTRGYPDNVVVAYTSKGKTPAFTVPASKQLFLYNARAFNNTGGAITVGILKLLVNSAWKLFKYVNVGPTYTSATSAIQAGTATNIFTGTINDGYIVQARYQFGMVGFTISTAQAGGTFTYKYWNGSAFATLPTIEVPADYSSAADTLVIFQSPVDWVVGGPTGVDTSFYSILVQSTVVPAGAVAINNMWIGKFLELIFGVPNNAGVQLSFPDSKPYLMNGGEQLIPYFSTAAATNEFGTYHLIAND